MDQYTRYYVNQNGGGIGPVYRASFRVQRGCCLGSFFRGLFRFVKPLLYSGDILNKGPEQPVSNIFKNRFEEAKDNLQKKIKNLTGSGLGLKGKRKFEKGQSQCKRRKVKDIVTKDEKNRMKKNM